MKDLRLLGKKLCFLGLKNEVTWTALPYGWVCALTTLKGRGRLASPLYCPLEYFGLYSSHLFKPLRQYPQWGFGSTLLSFQVNLNKMQPHFTLMEAGVTTKVTYSLGAILRFYLLQAKRLRRDTRRGALAISFFAKYYNQRLLKAHTAVFVKGYKKRYVFFLATALAKFSKIYAQTVVFFPQTLTGNFLFRRVKGIKKRIRKRLNRPVK